MASTRSAWPRRSPGWPSLACSPTPRSMPYVCAVHAPSAPTAQRLAKTKVEGWLDPSGGLIGTRRVTGSILHPFTGGFNIALACVLGRPRAGSRTKARLRGLVAAAAMVALLTIGVGTAAGQTSSTVQFQSSYRAWNVWDDWQWWPVFARGRGSFVIRPSEASVRRRRSPPRSDRPMLFRRSSSPRRAGAQLPPRSHWMLPALSHRDMTRIVPLSRSTRKTVPFMPSVCPYSVGNTFFFVSNASSIASGEAPSYRVSRANISCTSRSRVQSRRLPYRRLRSPAFPVPRASSCRAATVRAPAVLDEKRHVALRMESSICTPDLRLFRRQSPEASVLRKDT